MGLGALVFFAAFAGAKDSTDLAKLRRDNLEKQSFYCAIGRQPILSSADGLDIVPNSQCKFSGVLDTVLDPLSLQPPVLNPQLSLANLKSFLLANGVAVTNDSGNSFRFQISGASLTASIRGFKDLKDPIMHLKVYPPDWGETFTIISASRHDDLHAIVQMGRAHPEGNLFWNNPHFQEEQQVLPRRQHALPYLPIEVTSKCHLPIPTSSKQSLLLVGDLHDPPQSQFFLALLQQQSFSWVGLEFDQEQQGIYDHFAQATDPSAEEKDLNTLVVLFPKNIQDNFKNIMRTLKAQKTKTVFINSADRYLNFPFTNVSFHGLVVAARNHIWANSLPSTWTGTAALFGGLDHFTNFPGSDFQNFATERFPGLPMSLINPLETCFE